MPSTARHIFHIVGKSGFGRDLDLQAEPDDRFHFYVATGAPNVAISLTDVETSKWYHLFATYRQDNAIALYVNGKLENTVPIPGVRRLPDIGPITVDGDARDRSPNHLDGQVVGGAAFTSPGAP